MGRAARLPSTRVNLQGFQTQTATPRVYALGDLLVLPSLGHGETWGLCVNEAMNLVRPVLESIHEGCGPDLVNSVRTGWIPPAGDQAGFSAALDEALWDPQRLQRMGQAATDHIEAFSDRQATAGLLQALEFVRR